jgi:hypothetical protein
VQATFFAKITSTTPLRELSSTPLLRFLLSWQCMPHSRFKDRGLQQAYVLTHSCVHTPCVHPGLLVDALMLRDPRCDATDPDSCNNEYAIKYYNNFQRSLNVYDCGRFSNIWTCSNCSDAYKRWMCSQVVQEEEEEEEEEERDGDGGQRLFLCTYVAIDTNCVHMSL